MARVLISTKNIPLFNVGYDLSGANVCLRGHMPP